MRNEYDWTTDENHALLRLALPEIKFSMKSFANFFWADGNTPCNKMNHRACGRDIDRYCRWNPLELSYRRFIEKRGLISKNEYVKMIIQRMIDKRYAKYR